MRKKLQGSILAIAIILAGACKKGNTDGGSYYFTFQSGSISYSTAITDSTYVEQINVFPTQGVILTIAGLRTLEETDSAAAGLIALATWSFRIYNTTPGDSVFIGTYTTDSSSSNTKKFMPDNDFHVYTSYDPHKGYYLSNYSLPFSLTITEFDGQAIAGYFSGQMVNSLTTSAGDTITITNGKFRLPR